MSRVITLRIPNEIYKKLKESDKPIKESVILALQRYFYYDNLTVTPVNRDNTSNKDLDIDNKVDILLNKRWRGF